MDSTSRDSWRTYGNGITSDSQSIQLTYPPSPPKADDTPLHTNTQLSEPVAAFGSPRSEEMLDDLLNQTPARHVAKPASPQQANNAPGNSALAGVGSGGGGVGGVSTPNAGGGGGGGTSGGGGGGGGANWNQLLNNYLNMVGSALNPGAAAATPTVQAASTTSPTSASVAPAHTATTAAAPTPATSTPAAPPSHAPASKPRTPQDTPTVGFGSSVFTASETDNFAAISVDLSAPSDQTVTVQFNTSDGTAKDGVDYRAASYNVTFLPGETSSLLTVFLLDDDLVGEPSPATVNLILSNPSNATLSSPNAVLDITEDSDDNPGNGDIPPGYVPDPTYNCNCGCPGESGNLVQPPGAMIATRMSQSPAGGPSGSIGNPLPAESMSHPVRYADGVVTIAETDLHSDGFGFPWGQTRSWTNGPGYADGSDNGNGWVDTYTPHLIGEADNNGLHIIVVANGTTAYYFDQVNNSFQSRLNDGSQFTYNSTNDTYTLTDTQGDRIVFNGFGLGWQPAQKGQFVNYTNADGVTMAVTSYTSDGHIAEMQRSATSNGNTTTESFLYSYLPSTDPNAGLLSNVTLRTQVNGGAWSIVQQVAYTYYDGTQQYGGNLGDLMTATVEDGSGNVLSTSYYRYYTAGAANGYQHGLEYVFNPASYYLGSKDPQARSG
jgi:hypothetical protein